MVEPLPRRFLSSHKSLVTVFWIATFASLFIWQFGGVTGPGGSLYRVGGGLSVFWWTTAAVSAGGFPRLRPVAFNLTDFGAVGDGVTMNTEAFERAIVAISKLAKKGGGQLNVPPGRWLTAPFNLTSYMTLFLADKAEILAVQVSFATFCSLFLLSDLGEDGVLMELMKRSIEIWFNFGAKMWNLMQTSLP